MHSLGFNYRMPDILAALGSTQLKKLEKSVKRRNEIASIYDQCLPKDLLFPNEDDRLSAYHLYVIRTPQRKELYDFLREKEIFCQVHYLPVYWHPFYQERGFKEGLCPVAEDHYRQCLSLPMYPTLTDQEVQFVIDNILNFNSANSQSS